MRVRVRIRTGLLLLDEVPVDLLDVAESHSWRRGRLLDLLLLDLGRHGCRLARRELADLHRDAHAVRVGLLPDPDRWQVGAAQVEVRVLLLEVLEDRDRDLGEGEGRGGG